MKNNNIILLLLIIIFNNLFYNSNTYKEGFDIEKEIGKLIDNITITLKGGPGEIIHTMAKDEVILGDKIGKVVLGILIMFIQIIVCLVIIASLIYFTVVPPFPIPVTIANIIMAVINILLLPVEVYASSNRNETV
jgi:hypothetical protein|tara:strand:- start:1058 stop:1462 length:405 start_codon:yes stop_codon:yes gene_type:complete